MKLVQAGGANRLASLIPQRGPVPTGDEDQANPAPGIETRTVTLDRGDTLAGAMEDVAFPPNDANAAIAAMGKDFQFPCAEGRHDFDLTIRCAGDRRTGARPKPKTAVVMVNHKPVTCRLPKTAMPAPRGGLANISRLLSLHFSPTIEQDITITPPPMRLRANMVQKDSRCITTARAPPSIPVSICRHAGRYSRRHRVELIRMFSYKVDFQRDLQPGDSSRSITIIIHAPGPAGEKPATSFMRDAAVRPRCHALSLSA